MVGKAHTKAEGSRIGNFGGKGGNKRDEERKRVCAFTRRARVSKRKVYDRGRRAKR